ncbi:MAG: 2-oxoglutarate and iron-dependent oxygenase domain-containing protein, partial [Xenophilus sp.]
MSPLPLIDISPLAGGDPAGRARVAAEVGAACRGTGFFAITGHG